MKIVFPSVRVFDFHYKDKMVVLYSIPWLVMVTQGANGIHPSDTGQGIICDMLQIDHSSEESLVYFEI